MLHKEVILFDFGVSQLHLLLLIPLTHGKFGLDILNGAFLAICKVDSVQILDTLSHHSLI